MKKDSAIIFFLGSILENIEAIEEYTSGLNYFSFNKSFLIQDAVSKRLENIGEAAKALPQEFKKRNDHIPWQDAADMRNFLIHEYFGVDEKEVWNTVKNDIPPFKKEIEKLLENLACR